MCTRLLSMKVDRDRSYNSKKGDHYVRCCCIEVSIVEKLLLSRLPGHPSGLHPVGERDVVAPDVELPLAEADDAAEHVARVHADPHVHVRAGHLAHRSGQGGGTRGGFASR